VSRIFGPVRQTAYLVRDIESAMRHWTTTMGVGPFFLLKEHAPAGATFRDRPTDMCISLAFAQCGAVQIELIQQHNAAPSLFKEALDAGREGLHHLAFWTDHFDRDMARYREAGYQIVQAAGLGGPNNRNAFFEPSEAAALGLAIEVSEISGAKGEFFRAIAAAADGWDGCDPVRPVGGSLR
jgi:hypothetical protein